MAAIRRVFVVSQAYSLDNQLLIYLSVILTGCL